MDDADLAGPLLFVFCFGTFLLFVRDILSSYRRCTYGCIGIVWKATVRIYLRSWRARLALHLYPPQPHVRKGHRRIPRGLRARILSTTYGRSGRNQRRRHSRVRLILLFLALCRANSVTVAWWDTYYRRSLFSGAHMQHPAYSSLCCGCRTRGCCSHIPLDFCMAVSPCSVYSTRAWEAALLSNLSLAFLCISYGPE